MFQKTQFEIAEEATKTVQDSDSVDDVLSVGQDKREG